MSTSPRVTRPSQLPRQRGPHTSAPGSNRDGRPARALARPGVRPVGPGAPRPVRRAPRIDYLSIADSAVGLLVTVAVLMAAIAAIALVGAWWLGF